MKWIGITGGIATGKSLVCKKLSEKGFSVVDADELSHFVTKKGEMGYELIISHFGTKFLRKDKEIDRLSFGHYVFSNPKELKRLESLLHPLIQEKTHLQKLEFQKKGDPVAFHNIPLLYEKKKQLEYDRIAVVYCTKSQQVERLGLCHPDMPKEDILLRIESQICVEEKRKMATDIIDNSKNFLNLDKSIENFLATLR